MSLQSGITATEELKAHFAEAAISRKYRIIKVEIKGESLEHIDSIPVQQSFIQDLAYVSEQLEESQPCYMLVLLDDTNQGEDSLAGSTSNGNSRSRWLFCSYVPDTAPVRQKMLYASTRATLSKNLGDSFFVDSIYGTNKSEFTAEGYNLHRKSVEASAPLTQKEQDRKFQEDLERQSGDNIVKMTTRSAHVSRASINIDDNVITALQQFQRGELNLVVVKIDLASETLVLEHSLANSTDHDLQSSIPESEPRFAYYRHEDQSSDSGDPPSSQAVFFIYSCPSQSKVRERMIYSTFRNLFFIRAESEDIGIKVTVKLEIDSLSEISPEAIKRAIDDSAPIACSSSSVSRNSSASNFESSTSSPRPVLGQSATKFRKPAPPGRARRL